MRENIKSLTKYDAAKKALNELIKTVQVEMVPIMHGWTEISDSVGDTMVSWEFPELHNNRNYLYGVTAGMYCLGVPGDYYIFLPKTTVAYSRFYDAMLKLYENHDTVVSKHIFNDIGFIQLSDSEFEIRLVSYGIEDGDISGLEAYRIVARDLEKMLSDYVGCDHFTYFEEDDSGQLYTTGDKIPSEYYVGVKANYDFYDVNIY